MFQNFSFHVTISTSHHTYVQKETTQHEFIQLHRINKHPYKFRIWTYASYDRQEKKRGGRTKIHLFLTFKLIRKEFYRHYWIVIACICYARKEKLDKKETNLKLFSCSRNQIDLDSFLPSSFFLSFFAIQVFRILLVEIFFPNRVLHLTKWNTSNCAVLLMKIKQSNRKPNKFSFFLETSNCLVPKKKLIAFLLCKVFGCT